ncbi:unnamed protein product [Nippostrongylus brasiliensis]|uniref:Uncharacterized protein n=1 Tax=Nippostrongylus brasiliensis TaxID=27835 RepID=A0A0N4YV92_NIPBR|nr:unnamed protein product [Nippostrongylus brasiliensis]
MFGKREITDASGRVSALQCFTPTVPSFAKTLSATDETHTERVAGKKTNGEDELPQEHLQNAQLFLLIVEETSKYVVSEDCESEK